MYRLKLFKMLASTKHNLRLENKKNVFGDRQDIRIKLSLYFIIHTGPCKNTKPNHFAKIFMYVNTVTSYTEGLLPHILFFSVYCSYTFVLKWFIS